MNEFGIPVDPKEGWGSIETWPMVPAMPKPILILVMSARAQPWGALMDVSMQTWDSELYPNVKTFYYCGFTNEVKKPRTFYSQIPEDLGNLTRRTYEAFKHALLIPGWQHMARPNSSCYVRKSALVEHIKTLPANGVMQGLMCQSASPYMWGGGQFIFSRDVVERMVEDPWPLHLMEDVAMSRVADRWGIRMDSNGRLCSLDKIPEGYRALLYNHGESFCVDDDLSGLAERVEGHYFFRVKQDGQRHLDLELMRKLFREIPR